MIAEAFGELKQAAHELVGALKKFEAQTDEIETNGRRLAEAQTEERDLLAREMDEAEQIGRLSKIVALQRLLGSRIEQGRSRLESAHAELQRAADEATGLSGAP